MTESKLYLNRKNTQPFSDSSDRSDRSKAQLWIISCENHLLNFLCNP